MSWPGCVSFRVGKRRVESHLLERAFRLREGIAEREENGSAAQASSIHRCLQGSHHGFGEDAVRGGETNERRGLDVLNDGLECAELTAIVVTPCKDPLV